MNFLAYLVMQAVALPFAVLFWWWYSGRSNGWVEGRRRGWFCFIWAAFFVFFQALALVALDPTFGEGEASGPMYISFVLLLLVLPLLLVFSFVWAPDFVLPGWIRERRRLGDQVQAQIPPEYLRLRLQHPVNQLSDKIHPESLQLPVTINVRRGNWFFGVVASFGSAAFMVSMWLGVPNVFYNDPPAFTRMVQVASVVLIPLLVLSGTYLLRGALNPEPVTIAEKGVKTPAWQVSFSEIEHVAVVARETVGLKVTDKAFARCAEANKWFSGRPLGVGGLVATNGWLRLQPGLKEPAEDVARLIEELAGTGTTKT